MLLSQRCASFYTFLNRVSCCFLLATLLINLPPLGGVVAKGVTPRVSTSRVLAVHYATLAAI